MRIASSREIDTEEQSQETVAQAEIRRGYNAKREETEKPYRERKAVEGRNGSTVQRKYHLTTEQKAAMIDAAAATGTTVNPLQGRAGAYWGQVQALIELGINEYHSLKKIRDKMEEIMSAIPKKKVRGGKTIETTLWADFYDKPKREGAAKPKEGIGRIEQNFKVLQRLPREEEGKEENNPYGYKLAQFGMCIDIEYRVAVEGMDPLPYFRLNTTHAPSEDATGIKPIYINPNSSRRGKKAKAAVAAAVSEEVAVIEQSVPSDIAEATMLPSENPSTQEITEVGNSLQEHEDLSKLQEEWDAEPCMKPVEEEQVA